MACEGIITILLKNDIRVDMTVNQSVRIMNPRSNAAMCISSRGDLSVVLHPSGSVYQYGSRVDLVAFGKYGNNKYAKMSYEGVKFSSDRCAVAYVMHAGKIRTTLNIGAFTDMTQDISLPVFFLNARRFRLPEALAIQLCSRYWVNRRGTENWVINGVRVSQYPNGRVRVAWKGSRYQMVMSSNGEVALSSPFIHCTATEGKTSHLFVRRGERRMLHDGSNFILWNGRHSAGFVRDNQFRLF